MASIPLNECSIEALVPRLQARHISAREVVQSCLARITEREAQVRAWTHLDAERALAQAQTLDDGPLRGPLHGIPVAVKDIFDTFDMPTCYGSTIHAGRQPEYDAPVVALLRQAGAVVLGKSVTTEFAYFKTGPTANPHDLSRTPGGSSSGSAAAVADAMVPLALGSQTAGSIIRPASFCGVVGFKARYGGFPMSGVSPLAWSLDSFGWFTRSVGDAACVFRALNGSCNLKESAPSIGLCRTQQWPAADRDMQACLQGIAEKASSAGARVDEVEVAPIFAGLLDAQKTIMAFEAARSMAAVRANVASQISPELMMLLDAGSAISYATYTSAIKLAAQCRGEHARINRRFDVLLTPSAPGEAPVGLKVPGDPIFNRIWTLLGVPALSLPAAVGANGLPLGAQMVGSMYGEAELFSAAAWIERLLA
jgi:Asp-tRNA(Asn)/Glu-tRNA(Gln) amidotransferase A subunit family amidase